MSFVIQQPMVVSTTTEIDIPPSADLIDCIGIEIINDTTFAYNIVLPGGKQSYMAPQTIKFFAGTDWYGDYTKIFPLNIMTGTWTGIPQKLVILGYRHGEQCPVDGYVQNISKAAVVGNAITVANMNILQNDGAGAGTTIIETTVAGQSSSNQNVTNDGIWNLGVIISGAIVKFLQTANVDPIVSLGALSHIVEVIGGLTVDQGLILKGTTNFDNGTLLSNGSGTITASNTLTIQALSSGTQQTMLQIVPGTNSSLATIQLPTVLGDVDTAPGFSTRIGTNLRNTGDVGIESASYLTLGGEQGFLLKQNNYFDGSNHRFASANTAYFWDLGGSLSGNNGMLSWRQSTNTPVTNGVITWGSWNLVNANTANNATTAATATNVSSGFVSCTTINATGIASIAGVTTLASNANVGGTFSTTGNATLNSNLVVSGTAGISGVTTLASNANVGGTFSTTGAVSLPSTATIGSVSVTGNEHVNGTSVIAGAGTAFSVTNSATIGQDLNVFGNLTLTNGPGTFNRLFANIQVADNNAHIYTNSDHGNLVVTKSDGTTTIASFNDTTGLNVTGSVTLNGAATNKISSNNIVQGSIFNGSSSSTTANQTFNHNFNSANGNPLAVYLIDITGTQPAQQFVIVSITSTQVTFKSSGTGSFTGFAVRA